MTTAAPSQALVRPTPGPRRAPTRDRVWVAALFTVTAFVGAGLLFTVQPLVARLLLPAYGGSATVWSTCSLFFQTLLIVGYVYSHVTTTQIPRRAQPWLHLVVLATPLVVMPVVLPANAVPGADHSPATWLLRTLLIMIGLPFVVLATTGPLLQRWYSWSDGPRRDDPYFLFAASNVGSFGGLLAYPFLVEPRLTLEQQSNWFTGGFVVFVLLTAACAAVAARGSGARERASAPARPSSRPSAARLARWCGYAFVPSGLMLAVTHHLSTDVAPIPLLWVAPLAIYLATFVAAFAVRSRHVRPLWSRVAAGLGLLAVATAPVAAVMPLGLTLGLNMLIVALSGYAAHRLLAADRPDPEHLTLYYLAVAVGGALGGAVNGLLAPVLFDRVLEYELLLIALPVLVLAVSRQAPRGAQRPAAVTWLRSVFVCTAAVAAVAVAPALLLDSRVGAALALSAALVCLGWVLARKPVAMMIGLIGGFLAVTSGGDNDVVHRDRTFYGSYVVRSNAQETGLSHGTTLHGLQLHGLEQRAEPTTYYGRGAPLGDLLTQLTPHATAAVGLGVGTLAAYGEAGDTLTFMEIDEAVATIASDRDYFTFVSDSPADVDVRIGDGRLLTKELPDGGYDLVLLDAFNSDAIPIHLLTVEAFTTYASKVTDDGAIAVHVSNRHFDLVPVIAGAARHLGWTGAVGEGGSGPSVFSSTWVVISPDRRNVDGLLSQSRWRELDTSDTVAWTDDYSSLLSVLK